jgi:hypothetical protein
MNINYLGADTAQKQVTAAEQSILEKGLGKIGNFTVSFGEVHLQSKDGQLIVMDKDTALKMAEQELKKANIFTPFLDTIQAIPQPVLWILGGLSILSIFSGRR